MGLEAAPEYKSFSKPDLRHTVGTALFALQSLGVVRAENTSIPPADAWHGMPIILFPLDYITQ